jgi:hypothetical protein
MEIASTNFPSIIPTWGGKRLLTYSTSQSSSAVAGHHRSSRALPAPHRTVSNSLSFGRLYDKNVVTTALPLLSSCRLYTITRLSGMTTRFYLPLKRRSKYFWRWQAPRLQPSWRRFRFVSFYQSASPESYLWLIIVLKLPSWFPGASFKRLAIQSQKNASAMINIPFNYARERAVSIYAPNTNESYQHEA